MTEIISFVPKDEVDAVTQIEQFIDYACANYMGIIGLSQGDFKNNIWSIESRILESKRSKISHLKFVRYGVNVVRGPDAEILSDQLIAEPFVSFLKAIFLQRQVSAPTQSVSDLGIILRALEHSVRRRLGDDVHPVHIARDDIIATCNLVTSDVPASAYRRAVLLKSLVTVINERRLSAKPIRWENPFDKPKELRLDISPEAALRRQEKIPSNRSLRVLIQLAMWALEGGIDKHVPVASVDSDGIEAVLNRDYGDETYSPIILGIALCALGLNCRISELALMPFNPESFTLSKGELDSDGIAEDEDRFALRWLPVKGGAPMVKPFSRQFAPFAELIIRKLKELSDGPRQLALFYERNPKKLYLPPELEYLRNFKWLSSDQVSLIAGVLPRGVAAWAKRNSVKYIEVPSKQSAKMRFEYSFASLESALLLKLPPGFPYIYGNLKYSDAMFACLYNQTAASYKTCRVIPSCFSQSIFENSIGVRKTEEDHKTIFEIFGFYEEDGSLIDINTHEFRHFWQTQLKHAGVSEMIAAYAAGRVDISQNEAYDKRSPEKMADISFSIVDRSATEIFQLSTLAVAHEVLASVVNAESKGSETIVSFSPSSIVTLDKNSGALNVQGCHISRYGICRHSYVSSGCKKYNECLECDDLYCIKGVKQFEDNALIRANILRDWLLEYRAQVNADLLDGVEDADNWLTKTNRQLEKLERLIEDVYLNESVPIGTVIQFAPELKNSTALAEVLIERLGPILDQRYKDLESSTLSLIGGL